MSDYARIDEQFNNVISVLEKNASKWPETLKALKAAKQQFEAGEISFGEADRFLEDYRQYAGNPGQAKPSSVAKGMCAKLNSIAGYCRSPLVRDDTTESDLETLRNIGHQMGVLSEGLAMGAFPSVTQQFENFKDIVRSSGVMPDHPNHSPTLELLHPQIAACENLFLKFQKQKAQMTTGKIADFDDLMTALKRNSSKWPLTLKELEKAKERAEKGSMSQRDIDRVLDEYRQYAADPGKAKASSVAEGMCAKLNSIAKLCNASNVRASFADFQSGKLQGCARELGVLSEGLATGAFPSVTARFEDFRYITRSVSDMLNASAARAQRDGKPMNPVHEALHSKLKDCEKSFEKLLAQKSKQTPQIKEQETMKATLKEMREGPTGNNPLKSEPGRRGPRA